MNPLTRFPEAEQVLRQIEECAQQRSWPIVGPVKGRLLEALVQRQQPHHVLEVGTMVGYSAILMARRLPPSAKLWTLEVSAGAAETASRNVQRAGLDNVITIVLGDALETLPSLSGPFDLVFLDGTKEQYLDYLRLVEAQIPAGGIVVADNAGMFAQEMASYLEYVRTSGNYLSQYYNFGFDGVEVSQRLPAAQPLLPDPVSVGAQGEE